MCTSGVVDTLPWPVYCVLYVYCGYCYKVEIKSGNYVAQKKLEKCKCVCVAPLEKPSGLNVKHVVNNLSSLATSYNENSGL